MLNFRHIARTGCLFIAMTTLGATVAGCMHERHDEIPADAMIPASGEKQLEFTATESGMVYVYDRNNDGMLYSGHLRRGEMLVVDPERNRITINGQTVREKGIQNNDSRRIFFKAMPATEERVITEERRTIR